MKTGPKPRPIMDRLLEKVDVLPYSGCHEWRGATTKSGYGKITEGGRGSRTLATHRVVLAHATGGDKPDMCACHTCDNKLCCNPAHLYWGTKSDNARDAVARGRHYTPFRRIP